jgi:hypothetical protein
MNRRDLYEKCIECKNAYRNKGGNPVGCLIVDPRISDVTCDDYQLWWTRPPKRDYKPVGLGILAVIAGLLIGVPLLIVSALKLFSKLFGGLKVNKDNLGLYLPRMRK